MRQLFTVTSTVTQWTQPVTDSNTMHYSLASRHNFASFCSCDFYWDKRWQNNKLVYKEFFVNVVNVYHIYDDQYVFLYCNSTCWLQLLNHILKTYYVVYGCYIHPIDGRRTVCIAVPTALPVDSTDDFVRSTDSTLVEQATRSVNAHISIPDLCLRLMLGMIPSEFHNAD